MQNQTTTPQKSAPITTMPSISSDFFEFCTIHGVKEVKKHANSPTMAFWLIVMIGCFTGVSYEIYQIVSYYKANPGVTQVSWATHVSYKYPPMAFCPKSWLSWRRAQQLELSDQALAYVVSLVNADIVVDDNFDEDDVRRRVLLIMKRHNISNFIDLLKSISYEPTEMLRVMSSPSNVTFTPILQSFGVCYLVEVEPIPATTLRTNVMLRLAYRAPTPYFVGGKSAEQRSAVYDGRWQPRLLLKDSNGLRANFISFSKKAIYIIDLEAQVHTRMSRRDKICLSDREIPANMMPTERAEEYSAALCEYLCLEKERLKRSCDFCLNIALMAAMKLNLKENEIEPCFYYRDRSTVDASTKANRTVVNDVLDSIDVETEPPDQPTDSPLCGKVDMDEAKSVCASRCPPSCTQWLFKCSTSILSEDFSGEVTLWIAYNPMDGIMLYEEVPTYTLDTFISHIGGQLGLWLGASIISIVQIVYYACAKLCRKKNRKPARSESDEKMTGTQQQELPAGWPNGTCEPDLPPVTLSGV